MGWKYLQRYRCARLIYTKNPRREELGLEEVEALEKYCVRIMPKGGGAARMVSVPAEEGEIVAGVLAQVSKKEGGKLLL